jgi:hypothetical protein
MAELAESNSATYTKCGGVENLGVREGEATVDSDVVSPSKITEKQSARS